MVHSGLKSEKVQFREAAEFEISFSKTLILAFEVVGNHAITSRHIINCTIFPFLAECVMMEINIDSNILLARKGLPECVLPKANVFLPTAK